jgi:hypothetical protein
LGEFNAKAGREDIFKQTIGNDCSQEISKDSGVRAVDSVTSSNVVAKSTMFPHRHIHKYIWTSPEGKTHNQIDDVLKDRRWHSSIFDIRFFIGADCDTDQYLVVEKMWERLAASKRAAQKIVVERLNLKTLNEGKVKEQYQVTSANKFAALENLEDNEDFSTAWENIRDNIKGSADEYVNYCESKHHKSWFQEEYSKLVHRRKQANYIDCRAQVK